MYPLTISNVDSWLALGIANLMVFTLYFFYVKTNRKWPSFALVLRELPMGLALLGFILLTTGACAVVAQTISPAFTSVSKGISVIIVNSVEFFEFAVVLREACDSPTNYHLTRYIHHIILLFLCGLFGLGAWLQDKSGRDLMPLSLAGLRLSILLAFARLFVLLSKAPVNAIDGEQKRNKRRIRWLLWTFGFTFFSSAVILALSAVNMMPVPITVQSLLSVLAVGAKHSPLGLTSTSEDEGDTPSLTSLDCHNNTKAGGQ